MSALTSLILVLFMLLIAIAAVAWLTLTVRERAERVREEREAREARRTEPSPRRPRAPAAGNDRGRGARAPRERTPADAVLIPPGEPGARVRPRRTAGDDAFDRFLDPERRRREGGDR